jgi:hypothetical protein
MDDELQAFLVASDAMIDIKSFRAAKVQIREARESLCNKSKQRNVDAGQMCECEIRDVLAERQASSIEVVTDSDYVAVHVMESCGEHLSGEMGEIDETPE